MDEKSARLAIDVLRQRLREVQENYQRDTAELNHAISNIEQSAKNGHNGVAAGRWRGMTITDAIHAYLATHDTPVPFQSLLGALQTGGVNLGTKTAPNRYAANVKTTIANNSKRFRYNKGSDTVELVKD